MAVCYLKEDIFAPAHLSLRDAAQLLQVSRLTLSKVINKKGTITPTIAIRISKAFGGKADFWLRMQRWCDLRKAEQKFENNQVQIKKQIGFISHGAVDYLNSGIKIMSFRIELVGISY